jgi:hypothetical protein
MRLAQCGRDQPRGGVGDVQVRVDDVDAETMHRPGDLEVAAWVVDRVGFHEREVGGVGPDRLYESGIGVAGSSDAHDRLRTAIASELGNERRQVALRAPGLQRVDDMQHTRWPTAARSAHPPVPSAASSAPPVGASALRP